MTNAGTVSPDSLPWRGVHIERCELIDLDQAGSQSLPLAS
jgi:hypothetical protein